MSRTAGIYTAPASSWNPAVNGASATLSDWNALLTDLSNALTQSMSLDGQSTPTGNLPMAGFKFTGLGAGSATGNSARWEQLFDQGAEATIASATTTDIGAQNTNFLQVTGTTTITSFGANFKGPRFLRFAGALTLTHNASTLILPGAANITTATGDTCIAIPLAAGWYVSNYQTAAYSSLGSGTVTASTSGTTVDYTTIPTWARRVTISLSGVSTNGSSNPMVQIGPVAGIEALAYTSVSVGIQNVTSPTTTAYTTGFGIALGNPANTISGTVVLTLIDAATNTWVASGNLAQTASTTFATTAGSKALAGPLTRIRLTTVGGADTFDAGSVNVLWE